MRHHSANRKFGRKANVRRAFKRSLAEALILRGKIKTTLPRAKELRKYIEPLVTSARKNTLASQRLLVTKLGTKERAQKLIRDIAPKYVGRNGGYTRIVKTKRRLSDGSMMAIIEFV